MDPITKLIADTVRQVVREEMPATGAARKQRLLTLEQAAEYLGCSPTKVRNLEAAGLIKRFVWPLDQEKHKPYFDVVELDRRIDAIKGRSAA